MADTLAHSTVTAPSGFEVSSNFETPDEMQAAITPAEPAATPTTPDVVEPPLGDDGAADDDEVSAPPSPSAVPPVADEKVDKRTREGRVKSFQATIDSLRREQAEAEAKLVKLREEYAALKPATNGNGNAPTHVAPLATDPPKPTIDQFANDAEPWTAWQEALTEWNLDRRFRAEDTKRQQQQQFQQLQDVVSAKVNTTLERIAKAHPEGSDFYNKVDQSLWEIPNFAQVVAAGKQPTGETAIIDSVLDSLHPEKLLLYFTEHPAERQRISHLSPTAALREVAIVEGQFRATAVNHGPASVPRVASAAPPPTKPLGGTPVGRELSDDAIDGADPRSFDAMAAARRAKRR